MPLDASPLSTAPAAAGAAPGLDLPLWSALPFCLLLLTIAVVPMVRPFWWEHHRNKAWVAGGLALPFACYLILSFGAWGAEHLLHEVKDYVSFIALLGALFVISGGIRVRGSLSGTPLANTALLALGALIANLIGTTGASVLLIRPLLRANESRRQRVHLVIFFIFIVSNTAGMLTPLGDPPLFLGFLKGVPFFWTLALWPQWLMVNGALLALFHVVDQLVLASEERRRPGSQLEAVLEHRPFGLEGTHNFLFLGGMIVVILGKARGWGTAGGAWPFGVQEALMLLLAGGAFLTTASEIRAANRFTFSPIVEVAVLFAGIFVTMTAPLVLLNQHGPRLGLSEPWHYFWVTGLLSSFLDNAPSYLTFAAAAAGQVGVSADSPHFLAGMLATDGGARLLAAVSCGAVLMGANTYIGNGPNFMVKAIAEEHGVRMPPFFRYLGVTAVVLLPLYALVTLLFFR